jgi:hypothetical protein
MILSLHPTPDSNRQPPDIAVEVWRATIAPAGLENGRKTALVLICMRGYDAGVGGAFSSHIVKFSHAVKTNLYMEKFGFYIS